MKRLLILLFIIVIAPIVAGLYGIINDQLTYTISPEYYTEFKFYQFGLMQIENPINFPNPRLQVSIVGFLATWWMGLPIGIILGLTGLTISDYKLMLKIILKAFLVTIVVVFLTGFIGLLYGILYKSHVGVDWWISSGVVNTKNYIAVGLMYNFSYLGGIIGLIVGIFYIIRQNKKLKLIDIKK